MPAVPCSLAPMDCPPPPGKFCVSGIQEAGQASSVPGQAASAMSTFPAGLPPGGSYWCSASWAQGPPCQVAAACPSPVFLWVLIKFGMVAKPSLRWSKAGLSVCGGGGSFAQGVREEEEEEEVQSSALTQWPSALQKGGSGSQHSWLLPSQPTEKRWVVFAQFGCLLPKWVAPLCWEQTASCLHSVGLSICLHTMAVLLPPSLRPARQRQALWGRRSPPPQPLLVPSPPGAQTCPLSSPGRAPLAPTPSTNSGPRETGRRHIPWVENSTRAPWHAAPRHLFSN